MLASKGSSYFEMQHGKASEQHLTNQKKRGTAAESSRCLTPEVFGKLIRLVVAAVAQATAVK